MRPWCKRQEESEPDAEEAHEERSALQFTIMIIQSILQQCDITYDPALRKAFAR